ELIELFGDFDYLLVEGLKNLPLPRIAIFRNQIDERYLDYSEAIAIDESINLDHYAILSHIDILNLNDPKQVIAWIDQHAKNV
ncbi:MAG: molybdopterin-guanine dinucleotide biosynthesis protein MobB, partial [Campylobacterales bacterium]|nr:molybdopterin-guanine dinucleotide biosynthesis protein MobB [Campylobacterales bacterium]